MEKEILVHKVHGLSHFVEFVDMNGDTFFKAETLGDAPLAIYCPKSRVDEFFRKPLTEEKINELLTYMVNLEGVTTDGSKKQRDLIDQKLYSGDIFQLGYLFIAINNRKKEKFLRNQMLSSFESTKLKNVTKLLVDEISFVLKISNEEALNKLEETIKN